MGSTCCKRFQSPYSPKIPDFNQIFINCAEQFHICMKDGRNPKQAEPPVRKYTLADISGPLPLGIVEPKRPPRKKRCKLTRCRSLALNNREAPQLNRSNSIHEIYYVPKEVAVEPLAPVEISVPPDTPDQTDQPSPSSASIVESKRTFLAGLLATDQNSNVSKTPSRQISRNPSFSESLQDFANSLCDEVAEEEIQKTDYEERSWRPQIPVMSYQ
ncbi:uncharacterized protein LOC106665412 [Cimex lectularius]|uniref:Uncharacterized protein n=1 Tax=Cimex lectularius TaxID=79782 RepID=A0A8I6RP80_CIMLE|nr:uncharacterized protein LOC106665412 [Cimex lectularius]